MFFYESLLAKDLVFTYIVLYKICNRVKGGS